MSYRLPFQWSCVAVRATAREVVPRMTRPSTEPAVRLAPSRLTTPTAGRERGAHVEEATRPFRNSVRAPLHRPASWTGVSALDDAGKHAPGCIDLNCRRVLTFLDMVPHPPALLGCRPSRVLSMRDVSRATGAGFLSGLDDDDPLGSPPSRASRGYHDARGTAQRRVGAYVISVRRPPHRGL